ncbi:RNA-binding protein [Fortiea sp. LEGE XX443]|uniref:RNA recognition motif domain-containing protein n=1 Tax=Fortiea sp. LEGE XX443 TaxID=1828611 RepID=UPI00187F55F6|nr:RNA-binding protein [Fortiea sp. LEGE XX443]MBE9006185.1 RNA-binding protein [Fortiea sp. LEGE XX443]
MSIYVGNLSYQVTEEDLKMAFSEYGKVNRVQLPTDRETGRPRGFAFVEMETESQETAAIEALDGAEWMGRDLKVNKAKPREERSSPRGGGGGGWGNNNRGGGGGGGGRRY